MNLGASRGQIQAPRACSSSRTVTYAVRHVQYLETRLIQYTYIDCIPHNGRAVLDNKAKVRVTGSKCQRLRADAASNIDNQRALGKALPGVPCQFNTKSADGL